MSTEMTATTILTFVNEQLNRSETSVESAIRSVLNELNRHELLVDEDTGSIIQGASSLSKPTDYKSYISLQLTANGSVAPPLLPMPGGMKGMEEARGNWNSAILTGPPIYYTAFEDNIEIHPATDQAYTYTFKHYRKHPRSVADILYPDDWENVFNFGATYYTAVKIKETNNIAIWQPIYIAERKLMILSTPKHIRITGG